MNQMQQMLPLVQNYLNGRDWSDVPAMAGRHFSVSPLAAGEYNLNFRICAADGTQLVFRVNIGTQIDRDDQILYEFRALKLLRGSGFTPQPIFVDDSRSVFDRGILIMEYLPGRPLAYETDVEAAADLFAALHQVSVADDENHLIREDAPLTLIYDECCGLLQRYFASDLADPDIRTYLEEILQWAEAARKSETGYQEDPWPCIVNTEVNSGNFIVNPPRGTIHLVDWEMPRWGDPSQDLSHFCSPLTTLWKTRFRMAPEVKRAFIERYRQQIADRHLRDTLHERIRLRDPFVYLRGISWSAMGWVVYQTEFGGLKNPDTWNTLQRYMELDFIRSLFDPVINGETAK